VGALTDAVRQEIDLITARITELLQNPKPDYSIGGKSVSWGAYLGELLGHQKELMEKLQIANLIDNGPWEIRSYGM